MDAGEGGEDGKKCILVGGGGELLFFLGKTLEGKHFFNEKINRNGAEGVVFLWRLYYNVVKSGAKWFFVVENYCEGVKVAEGGDSEMFLGQYQHSIDAKGRLIVPAKFREGLGERFVVTKGLDNCLFAYPQEEWKIFEEKLKQLPLTNPGARKFVRFFFAGAVECELDNQGRIMVPTHLREYAGLKKDIVSIGVNNRIEIWNKDNWNEYSDEEDYNSNELAFEMENLGI